MAVVRIDDELLKRIRKALNDGENKYQYPSVAAFVNNAVYDKLRKKK